SLDPIESFAKFQGLTLARYDQMLPTDNFVLMDGTLPVHQLQQKMRDVVAGQIELKRYKNV
ncbi:MAG: dTMP kinase, partial [Candidatus Acidiferrales bacterium]